MEASIGKNWKIDAFNFREICRMICVQFYDFKRYFKAGGVLCGEFFRTADQVVSGCHNPKIGTLFLAWIRKTHKKTYPNFNRKLIKIPHNHREVYTAWRLLPFSQCRLFVFPNPALRRLNLSWLNSLFEGRGRLERFQWSRFLSSTQSILDRWDTILLTRMFIVRLV